MRHGEVRKGRGKDREKQRSEWAGGCKAKAKGGKERRHMENTGERSTNSHPRSEKRTDTEMDPGVRWTESSGKEERE